MELRRRLKDALLVHRSAILAHRVRGVKVAGDFVPDLVPTGFDVDHADRLLAAYNLAVTNAPATKPEDLWTSIARQQRSFFEVLESGDPKQLAAYLCNMSRHDATQGTVQGSVEYRQPEAQRRLPAICGAAWQKTNSFRWQRRWAPFRVKTLSKAFGATTSS